MANLSKSGDRRKVRKKLAHRNQRCWYCGCVLTKDNRTLEHVVPKAFLKRGGKNDVSNLRLACWPCNNKRGCDPVVPATFSKKADTP